MSHGKQMKGHLWSALSVLGLSPFGGVNMDLINYDFKDIMACMTTDKKLLAEARERGFYNGNTKYNKLFSNLFFSRGRINLRKDIDKQFRQRALEYLRAFMGSFEPKHEEKEAISALILSEIAKA